MRPHTDTQVGAAGCGCDTYILSVACILDRCVEDGHLQYLVCLSSGDKDWYDRSDLYDYGHNAKLMKEYDEQHPIRWDTECAFCGVDFSVRSGGCEECCCDECGAPCRHIDGVNFGCVRHPVI